MVAGVRDIRAGEPVDEPGVAGGGDCVAGLMASYPGHLSGARR
ncbi:hypothetical protein [Streptomyces cyaneus]